MSLVDDANERLITGREALIKGDAAAAIKDLTFYINVTPTVEAYLLRAEAHFFKGDLRTALADLSFGRHLCSRVPDGKSWLVEIDKSQKRYEAAPKPYEGPPVSGTVSAMIPIGISDTSKIWQKIADSQFLSTNGETLVRPGHSLVCDISVIRRSATWAQSIKDMADGALTSETQEALRRHANFLHITAPNREIGQATRGQCDLALQLVQIIADLAEMFSAPLVVLRTANRVISTEDLSILRTKIDASRLVEIYTRLYSLDQVLLSAGMHALGFADVMIDCGKTGFPSEHAVDLACDLLDHIVQNQIWNAGGATELAYLWPPAGETFVFDLGRCLVFEQEDEPRYNPFGVFSLRA